MKDWPDMTLEELTLEGVYFIAPSNEAAKIDAAIISRSRCPRCGGRLSYEPYYNGRTYRAFGRCKNNHVTEF